MVFFFYAMRNGEEERETTREGLARDFSVFFLKERRSLLWKRVEGKVIKVGKEWAWRMGRREKEWEREWEFRNYILFL